MFKKFLERSNLAKQQRVFQNNDIQIRSYRSNQSVGISF